MVLVSKYLVPNGYLGMSVFPFIFLKNKFLKSNVILINHERIHLRQQLEMLIIPFYIIYCVEFLIRLFRLRKWHQAYRSISFEKEAYLNEKDLNYLKSRSLFSFLKYM